MERPSQTISNSLMRVGWVPARAQKRFFLAGVGAARLCCALVVGTLLAVPALGTMIPAAPEGAIESGTPAFVVLGPEMLGLSSPPTDLHLLPNGTILVVAGSELAIGDGVRWRAIRRAGTTEAVDLVAVAVASDGTIFAGVAGGFARVEIGSDAQWRFMRVGEPFGEPELQGRVLSRMSEVGDEWFWHSGSGPVVSWRPGVTPRLLGLVNNVERVFGAGGRVFVSDGASGDLLVAGDRGFEPFSPGARNSLDTAVTATALAGDGGVLVGLGSVGVQRFDGQVFRPLVRGGALGGRHRVNDLCAIGQGLYGAALDNLGVAFFDHRGRIVQVVERSVNHRLARVRRLVPGVGGTVWALLNDGLACMQFPSRFSEFEAFVATGLTYSQVFRSEGRLWLQADGRVQRGIYDEDGRLLRFEVATPEGAGFVNTLSVAPGPLYACAEGGLYRWTGAGWRCEVPGPVKPHIARRAEAPGQWLYVALGEVGWLRWVGEQLQAERFPLPELGEPFVGISYGSGAYWAELGSGRVARIVVEAGRPRVRVFDQRDGLPGTWVQVFVVDGEVRFNVGGHVSRYDRQADRIVEDAEALRVVGDRVAEHGRPERDAFGRLWVAKADKVAVVERSGTGGVTEETRLATGLAPILFTMEEGGVVWMHQRHRLVRYDPAIPEPVVEPLRVLIGDVKFTGSDRHSYFATERVPDLDFRDNSLAVQLFAPGSIFRQATTFEVMLVGGGDTWSPAGTAGVASFARLKEGRYVLHARARRGQEAGPETTLAFTIRPPWFRTTAAYAGYAVVASGAILLAAWGWLLLTRRERERLARLVELRTAELRSSEERYRRLNEELELRVEGRTADLHQANALLRESNRELEAYSYTIAHDLRTPLRNISGFTELLRRRGSAQLDAEGNRFLGIVSAEAGRLGVLIDGLLAFARISRIELKPTWLDPRALVDGVVAEFAPSLADREVEWRIGQLAPLYGDPTLLRQVYANLIGNALKFTAERQPAVVEIGCRASAEAGGATVYFVRDNGIGFDPKYAAKLFGVFERLHTAKRYEGTGIGLAKVRRIVAHHGGRVWAEGRVGEGATFCFSLPQPRTDEPHGSRSRA